MQVKHSPAYHRVQGAGGNALSCTGSVTMQIRAGNLIVDHTFLVIQDLIYECILGQDFWAKHQRMEDNTAQCYILTDGSRVPFYNVHVSRKHVTGWARTSATVLKPNMITQVECKVRDHIPVGVHGELEPVAKPYLHEQGVFISPSISVVSPQHTIRVAFLNLSDAPVTLPDLSIGEFHVFDNTTEIVVLESIEDMDLFCNGSGTMPCDADAGSAQASSEGVRSPSTPASAAPAGHDSGVQAGGKGKQSGAVYGAVPRVARTPYVNGKTGMSRPTTSDGGDGTESRRTDSETPQVHPHTLPPGFTIPDHADMTPEYREMISEMVKRAYAQGTFSTYAGEVGLTDLLEARLETVSDNPVRAPYKGRMDQIRLEAAREIIANMQNQGLIRDSSSAYSSPPVLTRKPSGKWRFTNDFRALNAQLTPYEYPLPRIDEYHEAVAGNTWFATIDLSSGYWHIPIAEEHKSKTAFNIPGLGNYEYNRLPMGLSTSTAYFQRLMAMVLKGLPLSVCLPYLDDIIIIAKSLPELVERCEAVFAQVRAAGLKINPEKTVIGVRMVKFLGFMVSKEGIHVTDDHIRKVVDWPAPRTVKDVRRFLGLAQYVRKHLADYARVAAPLQAVLGLSPQHQVHNNEEIQAAFLKIKELTTQAPVLAFPDFSADAAPFQVHTDACILGCGATLIQEQEGTDRVIMYASATFGKSPSRWPITEKEAYGIFWAITKPFRPYVYGREFNVYTDHKPCLSMTKGKIANMRMLNMALQLQQYQFKMFYVKGELHYGPDAMSRLVEALDSRVHLDQPDTPCPCPDCESERVAQAVHSQTAVLEGTEIPPAPLPALRDAPSAAPVMEYDMTQVADAHSAFTRRRAPHAPEVRHGTSMCMVTLGAIAGAGYQPDAVRAAQREDKEVNDLRAYLAGELPAQVPKGQKRRSKTLAKWASTHFLDDGIVYRNAGMTGRQLLVPVSLRNELLQHFHAAPYAAHMGVYRTLTAISRNYWWPGLSSDVLGFVRACTKCAVRNKPPHQAVRVRKQVEVPHIFERMSMDIQGPFPMSVDGYTHVINFMCLFTGWVEAVYLKPTQLDAKSMAYIFVVNIVLRYGAPRHLLSDRASTFVSAFVRETLKVLGVTMVNASAYHPQTNGKIERVHGTLNNAIAKLVDPKHDNWPLPYAFALHAYRTTANAVYGDTPYFLVHGRDCTDFADVSLLPPVNLEGFPRVVDRAQVVSWRAQLVHGLEHSRTRTRSVLEANQLLHVQTDRGAEKLPPFYQVGEKVWVVDRTPSGAGQNLARKWLPRYLTTPYRVVRVLDSEGTEGGLSYELRAINEDDAAQTITRNVIDLKRHYEVEIAKPDEVERVLLPGRPRKGKVTFPPPQDTSHLPVTGDDHGWHRIQADEVGIERILDHEVTRVGDANKKEVEIRYRVRPEGTRGELDFWTRESNLRAPRLIAEYRAKHPGMQDENYVKARTLRSERRKAMIGIISLPNSR